MIPFKRVREPKDFDEKARRPGARWLEKNPDSRRPKDYWSPFRPHLARGFHNLCAYLAMWIPEGTVDHYVSIVENVQQAYEWDNYRYASHFMNSSKGGREKEDMRVLDPFEIEDGWFEIILPSLQLVITNALPEHLEEQARYTLGKLHLQDDERVIRQRQEWYRMYQEGELSLEGMRKKAPLIARAIEKQNKGAGQEYD